MDRETKIRRLKATADAVKKIEKAYREHGRVVDADKAHKHYLRLYGELVKAMGEV